MKLAKGRCHLQVHVDYGGRQVQHPGDRAPMVRHVLLDAAWFDPPGPARSPCWGMVRASRERPADVLGQTGAVPCAAPERYVVGHGEWLPCAAGAVTVT